MNIRKLALDLLCNIEKSSRYSNIVLDNSITQYNLSHSDRAFLTVLVYGVIERKLNLDYYIDKLSSLPPSKIELKTRNILRLGIYQLKYLEKVPQYAAINESVNLSGGRSKSFVNAVLRQYLRTGDKIEFPDKDLDIYSYLSTCYSVCVPLAKKLYDTYGENKAENILASFLKKPPITISVNTLKISRAQLFEELCKEGYSVRLTEYSNSGIIIESASITELFDKFKGCFFVQDEASMLCVKSLDAKAGQTVIDACASPGSKSFGIAISMDNCGEVYSFDLHENKLSLISDGAARLGINIIETKAIDGRKFDETLQNKADRVLCDVPCSGYGIIAKKPEIRYKDPAQTLPLHKTQYEILCTNARYLKKDGILVYSTCTLLPEENQNNIEKFLSENRNFAPLDFSFGNLTSHNGMLTLFPDEHGTDGFFIARMIKNN